MVAKNVIIVSLSLYWVEFLMQIIAFGYAFYNKGLWPWKLVFETFARCFPCYCNHHEHVPLQPGIRCFHGVQTGVRLLLYPQFRVFQNCKTHHRCLQELALRNILLNLHQPRFLSNFCDNPAATLPQHQQRRVVHKFLEIRGFLRVQQHFLATVWSAANRLMDVCVRLVQQKRRAEHFRVLQFYHNHELLLLEHDHFSLPK